jgi:serine protease Do
MSIRRRSISSRLIWPLAVVLCGAMPGAAPLFAGDEEHGGVLDAIERGVQEVMAKCSGAIVRIEAAGAQQPLCGTGFFIDPNGTLYTSYSVAGESRDIQVTLGGRRYPAERLMSDMGTGIALLKIDAETPFLMLGKSRTLAVASPVIAIGFPMELPLTPSFGIVGGFDLKYMGRYFATTHIRANLPVQRGEGGAPLLNTKGEVVGILISGIDAGSASFVLPIEAAEKLRMDFVRFHEPRPSWIGLHVKPAQSPAEGSTAQIEQAIADGPAERAGLRAGDVLLQVGDRKITTPEDVLDASFYMVVDDEVPVRVVRGDQQLEFKVQPSDRPDLPRHRIPAIGSTESHPGTALKLSQ